MVSMMSHRPQSTSETLDLRRATIGHKTGRPWATQRTIKTVLSEHVNCRRCVRSPLRATIA